MNDTPVQPAPKKPKPRKKARRAAAPKPQPDAKVEYPGLTATECATGCTSASCVISGKPYCGHPHKGGQCDRGDHAAVERQLKAQKQLAVDTAGERFS